MPEPKRYRERAEITLLGRRLQVLDLTRELSPEIPVYPGHMKVAIWDHLTHAESKLRIGDTPFTGYAVGTLLYYTGAAKRGTTAMRSATSRSTRGWTRKPRASSSTRAS